MLPQFRKEEAWKGNSGADGASGKPRHVRHTLSARSPAEISVVTRIYCKRAGWTLSATTKVRVETPNPIIVECSAQCGGRRVVSL